MVYLFYILSLFLSFGGIEQDQSFKGKLTNNIYYVTLDINSTDDQTLSLQSQIDDIPDGTINQPNIIKLPKGSFWTEGNLANNPRGINGIIRIENRHNLIIEGFSPEEYTKFYTRAPATGYGGNVSTNDYSLRRHFWFIRSSNITMRYVEIEGSNLIQGRHIGTTPEFTPAFWKGEKDNGAVADSPAYKAYWEQEHAIDIRQCDNLTIEYCKVNGVWGDGVYVGGIEKPSTQITLSNLHLRFTGRQGIAAANDVDGLLIEYVWVDRGRRASIDLEPHSPTGFVRNVEIRFSKLHARMTTLAAMGNGDVSHIYFHDNEFSYGAFIRCGDSRELTRRKDWRIIDNVNIGAYGSPASSMLFKMTDDIVISGNTERIVKTQGLNVLSFDRCGGTLLVNENDFGYGKFINSIKSSGIEIKDNHPELELVKH